MDIENNIENLINKNRVKGFSFYFFFVCVLLVLLALLPVIKIQISAQSRGMVISETLSVPITSIVSGKIEKINMRNNLFVRKNDTLLVITQDKLLSEKRITEHLNSDLYDIAIDLKLVLKNKSDGIKTLLIQQEWQSYLSKVNEYKNKINQAEISYNRNNLLFQKGVISKAEFEKFNFELHSIQNELQSFEQNQKVQWQTRLQDISEKQDNLNLSIQQLNTEKKNYVIKAPISGVVENFNGLQMETFLVANQPIAQIAPANNLIVETIVSSNDIGLIQVGHPVNFQLDAFNYNQWGLAKGKVIEIEQNVTLIENQAFFKVRCSIENHQMKLKNGYTAEIKKGMTLTSRFIITERSVFELLFDKIDDWLNPKIIKNGIY